MSAPEDLDARLDSALEGEDRVAAGEEKVAALIRAKLEGDARLAERLEALVDVVLELAGAAVSSQVPGAAVAVGPTKAVARALIDRSIERRLGKPRA